MANSNLVELTGLWRHEAKDGKSYLAGSMGGARVLVLANGFKKEGSNEPDFRLCVARKEPPGEKPAEKNGEKAPF